MLTVLVIHIYKNFSGSYTDGSFTMAVYIYIYIYIYIYRERERESRTTVAHTLMARLPWLFRTCA